MAAACPVHPLHTAVSSEDGPAAAQDAERRWRLAVEAQRADLERLRALWPDDASPRAQTLIARMRSRAAAGGPVDRAVSALHRAYGGAEHVPDAVRRRLEHYARERLRLEPQPWPLRDVAESTDEPAIRRKALRRSRRQEHG